MKFIKERHLRVKSPVTIDGLTLAYDAFSRPRYSVTHLPITAKKNLERANRKLPAHLKKIIEVIDPIGNQEAYTPPAAFDPKPKPEPKPDTEPGIDFPEPEDIPEDEDEDEDDDDTTDVVKPKPKPKPKPQPKPVKH